MDWQPIETAPTETRVLLFFPWKRIIAIGYHGANSYQSEPDWTNDGGEALTLLLDPPSHWMPLPAPPTTTT